MTDIQTIVREIDEWFRVEPESTEASGIAFRDHWPALRAHLTRQDGVPDAPVYRHKVRGTHYRLLGTAQVQAPADAPLTDYEVVALYEGIDGNLDDEHSHTAGERWVRRLSEFEDGRFEKLSATLAVPSPAVPDDVCGYCTDCEQLTTIHNGRCSCGSGRWVYRVSAAPKPPTQGWQPIEAKPLVWNEYEREGDIDEWDAETAFGTFYSVRRYAFYFEALYDSTPMEGQHQSPDDAKIACQEDYSARLNAALPTPPAVEGE